MTSDARTIKCGNHYNVDLYMGCDNIYLYISLFATSATNREKKKVKTHKSAEKLQQLTTMIINSISK